MHYLLNFVYLAGLLTFSPWLVYKALTTGKYRRGLWWKFFGSIPDSALSTQHSALSTQHLVAWFHGVSVGEIHLLRQVVAAFRRQHPDWQCVISTTTDTGFDEARKRFPDLPVIYWPLDFSWAVRRVMKTVNPSLVVLAEGELWPNFLMAAQASGVPVAVINGRMSPRSTRRYRLLGGLVRRLFTYVDLFAAQTEEYAACYRELGAAPDTVTVTGSVKYDGVETERGNPKTRELSRLLNVQPDDLIWIAGSTQAPEEEIALDIYRRAKVEHPNLRLFLVPRQKESLRRSSQSSPAIRPSLHPSQQTHPVTLSPCHPVTLHPVMFVDTIGELGALWGLADVAFVGGSLDGKRGGQNMIEPAAYGAAVVFGPHVWNFRETATRLVEAGAAIQVQDAAELERTIRRLLDDAMERRRLGTVAQRFVLQQQGATVRTLAALERLIQVDFPA